MALPGRIQQGAFGTRDAAAPGGTLVTGSRQPQPRPALIQRGTAQSEERFVSKDGALDAFAVARALNQIQRNSDAATAEARANPLGNGHQFQGVALSGPLLAGTSSQAPNKNDAVTGQQFFDTTLAIPLWFNNNNWNIATGAVQYAAANGSPTYTIIEHGFGEAAAGFIITNVTGGVIGAGAKIVPAGDATDKQRVRIHVPVLPTSGQTLRGDIYVFR